MKKNFRLAIALGACTLTSSFIYADNNLAYSQLEGFKQIVQEYEHQLFNYFPENGLLEGRKDVDLDRFSDNSIAGIKKWQDVEDGFLVALDKIDPHKLQDTPEQITYYLLKENLQNNKEVRACKEWLWGVNPMDGWHIMLSILAEYQPVSTDQERTKALNRWQHFATVVNQNIDNLKTGLIEGYTAPKPAVKRVLNQVKMLRDSKIEDSPFYSMAKRQQNEEFSKSVKLLIEDHINPAINKYIEFLENEYLPYARDEVGVYANPNGLQCYVAKIKQQTTLAKSPGDIHRMGLNNIARLEKEVGEIGEKLYNTKNITEVFKRANNDTIGFFANEDDMLKYDIEALDKVKAKADAWFDMLPEANAIIKPYPEYRAKNGSPGEYFPPSDDGQNPGIFFMNTYEPQKQSRVDMEATLFHELIPGHHFQIALQYENKNIPTLNKYLWNSGYVEGWALYAERLADKMGLYRDEVSRLGMLSNEALRASRLVVDTGMHAFGWSREKAVSYLKNHSGLDENVIEGEIDRYIMLPAQANSYMLGKVEIESLRDKAKQKLGDKFNIREFHNQVLQNGAVSLPILREKIEKWLARN